MDNAGTGQATTSRSGPSLRSLLAFLLSVSLALAVAAPTLLAAPDAANPPANASTTKPTTKAVRNDGLRPELKADDGKFLRLHGEFLKRAESGPVGLLFLGDSITAGWATRAQDLFDANYGRYAPANFGIGGDRTQHILWRIANGELDKIDPRVVVLMIGTNNTSTNTSAEITAAITRIVAEIHGKLPRTKVLLLGIFPRGPRTSPNGSSDDGVKKMEIIREVNREIAKLDDGKTVRFLDIGEKFLVGGKIPEALMPDQLHPSRAGYEIWVKAMQPLLEELLKE